MAEVRFNTAAILERAREGAKRGIVAATEEVRNEALRLILETPKSGRTYRRRGVVHQASAPGQPPASDTGTLVGRITTNYDRLDQLVGVVTARTAYAAYLEFGTRRMAPRPFMRPALANKRDDVVQIVGRAIRQAVEGR